MDGYLRLSATSTVTAHREDHEPNRCKYGHHQRHEYRVLASQPRSPQALLIVDTTDQATVQRTVGYTR